MRLRLPGLLLAFLLIFSACGEPPEAPTAARQLLNLGLLITEEQAKVPNGALRGITLAISEYNGRRDSTYQARLRRFVTDGTPSSAGDLAGRAAATERMIGAIAVLSPDETAAAAPVFERSSVPFLATSAEAQAAPGSRTFRRLVANPRQEGAAIARYMSRRVSGAGVLFHDGSPIGDSFIDGAKEALDAAKRPAQSSQRISARTDLDGVLGSVPRDAQSFVLFGGSGALGAGFADVLRRGGFPGPIAGSHQVMEAKTEGLPEDLFSSSVVAPPGDARLRDFGRQFSAEMKTQPGALAVESYEGAVMLLEAVEEVEPKPKEIVEFLQLSRSFLGDSKSYEYDENGELRSPDVWVFSSQGGRWTLAGRAQQARRSTKPPD